MSEVKNIPRLRFPDFYSEWVNNRLGDLIDIKGRIGYRGYTTNDIVSKGEGSISLSPSNIDSDGNLSYDNSTYITWEKYFESPEIMVKEGFTILVKTGSSFGKSGLIKDLPEKSTINPQLVVLKPTKINPFFLFSLTTLGSVQKQIKTMVVGGTIPTLSQENISNFNVNIPSLPEQQKIADFLTAVDKRIELLEKKKTLLETYKKGVMKKIFNQEIRFKDDNGSDFPDWEEKKLGDITNKKSSNISANSIEFNEGNYTIYGATGELKEVDFFEMNTPYISIVKDGSGVGRVKLCKPYSSVLGTLDIITNNETSDLNFIYQFLTKTSFLKFVTGSSIPHIYYKDYSKLKLSVPSIKEQEKISKFMSSIDSQIELLVSQIDKSKTWKKGLLQKMFV